MTTPIVMCRFIFLSLVLASRILGATIVSQQSYYPLTSFDLDLDADFQTDVHVDISAVFSTPDDPYYLATPTGSVSIAGTGGITTSFSVGDIIQLSSLDFISSPSSLQTGGVYFDILGNVVEEGWGGCIYDGSGNLMCTLGGPSNQIDLFLVQLTNGVAWVDLDSSSFSAITGRIDVSWGYLENAGNTFTVTAVPEASTLSLISVVGFALLFRKRKNSNKAEQDDPRRASVQNSVRWEDSRFLVD